MASSSLGYSGNAEYHFIAIAPGVVAPDRLLSIGKKKRIYICKQMIDVK